MERRRVRHEDLNKSHQSVIFYILKPKVLKSKDVIRLNPIFWVASKSKVAWSEEILAR